MRLEIFKYYPESSWLIIVLTLDKLHILILTLLTVSVYWNSLDGDFVHDGEMTPVCLVWLTKILLCSADLPTIVNNKDVTGGSPWTSVWINDFWGTNMRERRSHKSYRPLTIITFRWSESQSQSTAVIIQSKWCLIARLAGRIQSSAGQCSQCLLCLSWFVRLQSLIFITNKNAAGSKRTCASCDKIWGFILKKK